VWSDEDREKMRAFAKEVIAKDPEFYNQLTEALVDRVVWQAWSKAYEAGYASAMERFKWFVDRGGRL
jgi:hypothetical protein